jgi:hypothetical protein
MAHDYAQSLEKTPATDKPIYNYDYFSGKAVIIVNKPFCNELENLLSPIIEKIDKKLEDTVPVSNTERFLVSFYNDLTEADDDFIFDIEENGPDYTLTAHDNIVVITLNKVAAKILSEELLNVNSNNRINVVLFTFSKELQVYFKPAASIGHKFLYEVFTKARERTEGYLLPKILFRKIEDHFDR